jgi:hypothetical protein
MHTNLSAKLFVILIPRVFLFLIYSDQLAQLKMNYTSNVHTISDIKNTLKENAEQSVNLGEFGVVLTSCE